jgi:hypothetical protein
VSGCSDEFFRPSSCRSGGRRTQKLAAQSSANGKPASKGVWTPGAFDASIWWYEQPLAHQTSKTTVVDIDVLICDEVCPVTTAAVRLARRSSAWPVTRAAGGVRTGPVASSHAGLSVKSLWRAEVGDRAFNRLAQVCDGSPRGVVSLTGCSHAGAQ